MNKITIYHYSNKEIRDKIDPAFFGANSFSRNSQRISAVKRSFFYKGFADREYYFHNAKFMYSAEVDLDKLYDVNSLKIKEVGDIYFEAKKRGYKGVYNQYQVILFDPIKIKYCQVLTSA